MTSPDLVGFTIEAPAVAFANLGFVNTTSEAAPDKVAPERDITNALCGGIEMTAGTSANLAIDPRNNVLATSLQGIEIIPRLREFTESPTHPNGLSKVDHLVLQSPNIDVTASEIQAAGFEIRRVRNTVIKGIDSKQLFVTLDSTYLEIVGPVSPQEDSESHRDTADSTTLQALNMWGIAFYSDDNVATSAYFGDAITPFKPAVQEGQQIAIVHNEQFDCPFTIAIMAT